MRNKILIFVVILLISSALIIIKSNISENVKQSEVESERCNKLDNSLQKETTELNLSDLSTSRATDQNDLLPTQGTSTVQQFAQQEYKITGSSIVEEDSTIEALLSNLLATDGITETQSPLDIASSLNAKKNRETTTVYINGVPHTVKYGVPYTFVRYTPGTENPRPMTEEEKARMRSLAQELMDNPSEERLEEITREINEISAETAPPDIVETTIIAKELSPEQLHKLQGD